MGLRPKIHLEGGGGGAVGAREQLYILDHQRLASLMSSKIDTSDPLAPFCKLLISVTDAIKGLRSL